MTMVTSTNKHIGISIGIGTEAVGGSRWRGIIDGGGDGGGDGGAAAQRTAAAGGGGGGAVEGAAPVPSVAEKTSDNGVAAFVCIFS